MNIAFRTDASLEIGSGHVMRCLTLADALSAKGASCRFICRLHEGNLVDLIRAKGYLVEILPTADNAVPRAPERDDLSSASVLKHADWLGVSQEQDAADCIANFSAAPTDWLIVDHYAIDAKWERLLIPYCRKLMIIDDLADRQHECDLLLDQNLGRVANDYAELIPSSARLLIGPRYALLRPEFARLRNTSLARRAEPKLEHLLVSLGGVDKDNVTTQVLDALDASALPETVRVTVVMGPRAPWLGAVQSRASRMRNPTEVLVDVRNMAQLMHDTDLAVGAGGSTTWERCTLGVPAIQVSLADNQRAINGAIGAAKAAITVDIVGLRDAIMDFLRSPTLFARIAEMCRTSAKIADGHGEARILSYMLVDTK